MPGRPPSCHSSREARARVVSSVWFHCLAEVGDLSRKHWPLLSQLLPDLAAFSTLASAAVDGSKTSASNRDAEARRHPCLPVCCCQVMCLRDCSSVSCLRSCRPDYGRLLIDCTEELLAVASWVKQPAANVLLFGKAPLLVCLAE